MRFTDLIAGGSVREITSLCDDSRKAGAGSLFVCVRGASADGHSFAKAAYDNGCRAFVAEHAHDIPADADIVIVPDSRVALAEVSSKFYGEPAKKLKIIGVTGTKGKTTTAMFAYHILNGAGIPTAYIGTVGVYYRDVTGHTANSTPESIVLHRLFADFVRAGVKVVVMEVSSQAVKMNRIHGIDFFAGAFLNLFEGDHIGPTEHADFAEYRGCKAKFCREFVKGAFVFNADSPESAFMQNPDNPPLSFSLNKCGGGCICANNIVPFTDETSLGITFDVSDGSRKYPVRLNLCGAYNADNALAAMQICKAVGVPYEQSAYSLASASVPGRSEIVGDYSGRVFLLDYAHNEASMRAILTTLRGYMPKRLVCLFGSVGDRSQSRRAGLGAAASELADFCIVTSDNPGREDPAHITGDIVRGFTRDVPFVQIIDRADAVRYAVRESRRGDIVVFAGKGHEDYQLIGSEKTPFSEKKIIADETAKIKLYV